jgi:peptidoglycan/LPS O-acetylase OafA/YrhL
MAPEPLRLTDWLPTVIFMLAVAAFAIWQTAKMKPVWRVPLVVATLAVAFPSGEAVAYHTGTQAKEWGLLAIVVFLFAAVALASVALLFPEHCPEEGAQLRAKATHDRLHTGAHAVHYIECEFCRREVVE